MKTLKNIREGFFRNVNSDPGKFLNLIDLIKGINDVKLNVSIRVKKISAGTSRSYWVTTRIISYYLDKIEKDKIIFKHRNSAESIALTMQAGIYDIYNDTWINKSNKFPYNEISLDLPGVEILNDIYDIIPDNDLEKIFKNGSLHIDVTQDKYRENPITMYIYDEHLSWIYGFDYNKKGKLISITNRSKKKEVYNT